MVLLANFTNQGQKQEARIGDQIIRAQILETMPAHHWRVPWLTLNPLSTSVLHKQHLESSWHPQPALQTPPAQLCLMPHLSKALLC